MWNHAPPWPLRESLRTCPSASCCFLLLATHMLTGLTPEGAHQAFHAQLMLHSGIVRQAGVPLSSLPAEQLPSLPEPLASHARRMWLASAVDVHVSKLQADVSAALVLAGIPNSMEWLTDDGMFSIDIAFEVREKAARATDGTGVPPRHTSPIGGVTEWLCHTLASVVASLVKDKWTSRCCTLNSQLYSRWHTHTHTPARLTARTLLWRLTAATTTPTASHACHSVRSLCAGACCR